MATGLPGEPRGPVGACPGGRDAVWGRAAFQASVPERSHAASQASIPERAHAASQASIPERAHAASQASVPASERASRHVVREPAPGVIQRPN